MPTSTQVKDGIDAAITNKPAGEVLRSEVGPAVKAVVDYVDQQVPAFTRGVVNSTGTLTPLIYTVNDLTGEAALYHLPDSAPIGTVIYAIGNATALATIQGNSAGQTVIKKPNVNSTSASVSVRKAQKIKFSKLETNYWYYETIDNKPYLSILLLISQSSTSDPTVSVLENETLLGVTITYARGGVGDYRILSSGTTFSENKTALFIQPALNGSVIRGIEWASTNQINISTYYNDSLADGYLDDTTVEIRIYP